MTNFFITGTDTGVGKTWFTVAFMTALKERGLNVMGMKPIATGAEKIKDRLINEDAKLIMQNCSQKVSYNLINPFVFELPIAPHVAAKHEGVVIELDQITKNYHLLKSMCDVLVVEGVGGWRVPVTNEHSLTDLVSKLNLSVILVVGMRLGCINHAVLTAEAIRADGLNLCGWVSNHLDRVYSNSEETIETLKKRLHCPHIADLRYNSNFDPNEIAKEIAPAFILGI
jgi:dethiobiotin synthetase